MKIIRPITCIFSSLLLSTGIALAASTTDIGDLDLNSTHDLSVQCNILLIKKLYTKNSRADIGSAVFLSIKLIG